MPEYRRDASGADWIFRPSWKAVRSDLTGLLREGKDCAAFKVRGGPKEGDEKRADLHPQTRDVLRHGTDDAPPRPVAADEVAADNATKRPEHTLDARAPATDQRTQVDGATAAGARPATEAPPRDTPSRDRPHPDRDPQVQSPSVSFADVRIESQGTGSHDTRRHHKSPPPAPPVAGRDGQEQDSRWQWWVESLAIALLFVAQRWRAAALLVIVLVVGFRWISGGDSARLFNGPWDDGTATTVKSEEELASARAAEAALSLDTAARRRIQESLEGGGADPGPADGVFGARTRAAIRRWQGSRGAPETGYLSRPDVVLLIGAGSDEREDLAVGTR